MVGNPLKQFKIVDFCSFEVAGYNIAFTNSAMFMIMSVLFIFLFFTLAFKNKTITPTRLQLAGELSYNLIADMLQQNVGEKGKKFVPLIFTLFTFLSVCNIFGMIPYGFTVTSHISITFAIAIFVFLLVTLLGFYLHGLRFLSLFLPKGTPWWLSPLMIVIELFAYLARPVSLSLRLTANMIAGHVLLKVMAGFVVSLVIYLKIFPISFIVILVGFEIFVAILQAYIFTVLSCVYLNDAINLH